MKLFENMIYQIREVIDKEFGVMDGIGLILACSDEGKVGRTNPLAAEVAETKDRFCVIDGVSFQKVYVKNKPEFITYICSDDEESRKCLSLISINVYNIRIYHEDKFDKSNFIKNIIMENIPPGDIALRAKELHLAYGAYRAVFLIKTGKTKDIYPHEVIQNLFPNKVKDFVVVLDNEETVLVKELKSGDDHKEIERVAGTIIDTLNTELMIKAHIGIGSVTDNIKDIGRSFKEARTALHIGGIFESDRLIISYNNLGLGRLIYQLPVALCKLFLQEVFNEGAFDALDPENLLTIRKFFENNLNISETSRQLYVHRNTLVYRLDKIQKMTGLDIRKFDDAIIFKFSMLVKQYLDKCGDAKKEA